MATSNLYYTLASLVLTAVAGCGVPTYHRVQLFGARPCVINKGIRPCLSREADRPVGPVSAELGALTTPFKRLGISGWIDYHITAEARGKIARTRMSTDQIFTVDVALKQLRVGNHWVTDVSNKFMRLEIYRPSAEFVASV